MFDDNTQEVVDQTSGEGTSMVKATANSAPATPFLLGEGLPPIPAKSVAKIQKREFVDMAELLRDDMEAERRRAKESGSSSAVGQSSQNHREVPDILSWIQCMRVWWWLRDQKSSSSS